MGNSILNYKVKGITKFSARYNMSNYHAGDFLKIVPEFDNPYDSHALAIYDDNNTKIGFVPKESNQYVYSKINNNRYICLIIRTYDSYSTPCIEFQIIYETVGTSEEISMSKFESLFAQYNEKINHIYIEKNSNVSSNCKKEKRNYSEFEISNAINNALPLIEAGQFDDAIKLLTEYYDETNSNMNIFLGLCYQFRDEEGDFEMAEHYYSTAIDLGDCSGYYNMGCLYHNNDMCDEAFDCFEKGAELDDVNSYKCLADYYSNNEYKEYNPRFAFCFYLKACQEEYSSAYYSLGNCYHFGIGTNENKEKAIYWYNKAIDNDDLRGYIQIAIIYSDPNWSEQNLNKSIEYLNKYRTISNNYDYDDLLGLYYYMNGDIKFGISILENAYYKGNINAIEKLCGIYKDLKDDKKFNLWYERGLNENIDLSCLN